METFRPPTARPGSAQSSPVLACRAVKPAFVENADRVQERPHDLLTIGFHTGGRAGRLDGIGLPRQRDRRPDHHGAFEALFPGEELAHTPRDIATRPDCMAGGPGLEGLQTGCARSP